VKIFVDQRKTLRIMRSFFGGDSHQAVAETAKKRAFGTGSGELKLSGFAHKGLEKMS